MAVTIQQEQLNKFFEILASSKLISELEELTVSPSNSHFVVIQSGANDSQKIAVSKLRGALGNYNASTNTPILVNGTGVDGDSYLVTVAGTRDFGNGNITMKVDDVVEYRNGKWLSKSAFLKEPIFVTTLPGTGIQDVLYVETTNGTLNYWDGAAFQPLSGGGAVIEDIIVDGETSKGASQNAIFDALALKVDKDGTKVLSDVNFSTAKDAKLAGLESSKFKGTYVSLAALQSAYPTTEEGSYAHVDTGVGSDVQSYIWDFDDSSWVLQGGGTTTETAASIKTKYESNVDTNAFTDAEKTNVANNTTHSARTDNPHTVTKAQVGLDQVNNTSDVNKPVSSATQTALNAKANSSQVLTDVPAGALFTDTVYNDTAIQADVDSKVKKRTIKTITTTVSYTLIAADFTDFILKFTANANEEISIVLNAGVAPLNGELQMISTGNNKLVPSLGVGVTATYPEQTNPKTILKGWLGGIVTATDTISFNGSLESTATGGIADAPSDGTAYNRKDAAWVVAVDTDTTYAPFTNTVDGLVPAPNVSGGTTYTVDITSPAEGATVTEGQVTSVTLSLPAGTATTATKKVLKSDGWQDDVPSLRPVKTVSTTTYTCVAEDATKWLRFTNASAVTVTIPNSVFTAEQELMGDSSGNNVIFAGGTGFTLNKVASKKAEIPVQGVFGLRFRLASSGVLFGSLKQL